MKVIVAKWVKTIRLQMSRIEVWPSRNAYRLSEERRWHHCTSALSCVPIRESYYTAACRRLREREINSFVTNIWSSIAGK